MLTVATPSDHSLYFRSALLQNLQLLQEHCLVLSEQLELKVKVIHAPLEALLGEH